MEYRSLPIGYALRDGKIATVPQEAETVRAIFELYCTGLSLLEVSKKLERSKKYSSVRKTWSKSSISRILRNEIYLGNDTLQRIVSDDIFRAAGERLFPESMRCETSDTVRAIRKLESKKSRRDITDVVCRMLNKLIENPRLAYGENEPVSGSGESKPLSDAVPAEPQTIEDAMSQAAAAYKEIGSSEFDNFYLQALLGSREPMNELDIELMKAVVKDIRVIYADKVRITLINNAEILSWEEKKGK